MSQADMRPLMEKLRQWMRLNCAVVNELSEEDIEVFFMTHEEHDQMLRAGFRNIYNFLLMEEYIDIAPMTDKLKDGKLVYWRRKTDGMMATITTTHIRLPKLSHLITLVPHDFFRLIGLVVTAKNAADGTALNLDPMQFEIESFESSFIGQYFIKLKTNYRMNPEYADRKWTRREVLNEIHGLEPNIENHLISMQLLTVLQNDDLFYFPVEAAINFSFSCDQLNEEYCVAPQI